MSSAPISALVMAANRRGTEDSVAAMAGVSHKCVAEIDGIPMIERVVGTLLEAGCFETIYVSIEDEDILTSLPHMARWIGEGQVKVVQSEGNLADSVMAAHRRLPDLLPVMITTGDNVLHTPDIIREFVDGFLQGDAELALGFARQAVVETEFPDAGLAYHQLKDGGFSSCNLFGLRNDNAVGAVEVFRGGGQFGKRNWRILKAFGVMPFLLYKLKAVSARQLITRIGRSLGVSIELILLPYSWGPIDVDNPTSFRLGERVLKSRRENG